MEFAKKSNITLVANATKKPSGTGTRLLSSEMGQEPLAISFDRQVVRLCDPSKEMVEKVSNGIRFAVLSDQHQIYIVDPRNIHGEQVGEVVGTISVIGAKHPNVVLEILPEGSIQLWWFETATMTILVANKEVDKVVRILHDQLL